MSKSLLFFAINHDDIHKFRLKFARATESKYACEDVLHAFMVEHVCIQIESYIRKILTFLNLVDDAQCQTSIDRVTNSFHDFLKGLLEGHFYNDYFLTSDLLFLCFYTLYIDIRILIDSAIIAITIFNDSNTAWLISLFSNYDLK